MPNFYAVRVGISPGIYSTWEETKLLVSGHPGAKYKKFKSQEEAQNFLNNNSVSIAKPFSASHTSKIKQEQSIAVDLATDSIVLYTDGSCIGNSNVAKNCCPAGWGVVVLAGSSIGSNPTVLAELFGPVIVEGNSPFFLGATVKSNNTGELTAIGEALLWLNKSDTTSRPAIIRYDSEYAAKSVLGNFPGATKNLALIHRIQGFLKETRSRRSVSFEHVKGHSSDQWNDRADVLANQGRDVTCTVGRYANTFDSVTRDSPLSATAVTDVDDTPYEWQPNKRQKC